MALDAIADVYPDSVYHVKIAVADVSDGIFDSGVFLGIESMCADSTLAPLTYFYYLLNPKTEQINSVTVFNTTRYARSFHWDFGDGYTTNQRNPPPHTYQSAGTYTITLTANNYCCSDSYSETVTIDAPNSISELAENGFTVYPNPVGDDLYVRAENGEVAVVNLFDITGKLVESFSFTSELTINTSAYAAGVYFINIETGNQSITDKLLKK